MTNLIPTGVSLVAQGATKFIQDMGAAALAVNQFTAATTAAASASTGPLGALSGSFTSVSGVVQSALSSIKNFFSGILQVAGGFLLRDIIRGISNAISEVGTNALNAAKDFQTLEISLQGLAASQFRAQGGLLDTNEALSQSLTVSEDLIGTWFTLDESTQRFRKSLELGARAAQVYLRWIRELAVTSPFEVEDIQETFRLAQSFQFTADESKTLTENILDFASAMGLSAVQMERIIVNFGQMRFQGKVTGTELRDLATGALVPTGQVLKQMAENLGVAEEDFEDFRKAVSKGKVDVDEFFKAFVDVVQRDFAGAGERLSKTLQGVISNAQDFVKTILGVNLLGPLMQQFAINASSVLNTLLSPAVQRTTELIGLGLGRSFQVLFSAVNENLIPALRRLAEAFGFNVPKVNDLLGVMSAITQVIANAINSFSSFVDNVLLGIVTRMRSLATAAFQWGANIVINLANGIVSTASTVLTSAMRAIGDLLAFWLQPGSPPRVAADILKWGRDTFTEFLRGFTEADFDILEGLQSPLKSALQILIEAEDVGLEQANEIFREISENISRVITEFNETGQVNTDVFGKLEGMAGSFAGELRTLLDLEFKLLQAIKAV